MNYSADVSFTLDKCLCSFVLQFDLKAWTPKLPFSSEATLYFTLLVAKLIFNLL